MLKRILKIVYAFAAFCMIAPAFAAKDKASILTEIVSFDVHGNANLAVSGSVFTAKGFSASDIVSVTVEKFKFTAPIVKNYSDVNNGDFLLRMNGDEISLAINMGSLQAATGAKVGSKVFITLKERYGYLNSYQIRMLKKSDDRSKFDSDEIFANFRSVSYGTVGKNRLYRSYSPLENDERGQTVSKLMEQEGISLVINLADDDEALAGKLKNSAYYKKLQSEGKVVNVSMGSSFSGNEFNAQLKKVLLFMTEHPDCKYLIHGKEGKNRTGYVTSVLLALSGATYEEISADYMASFENLYGLKKNRQQYELIAYAVPFMFISMNGGKKINEKNLQQIVSAYLLNTVGLTNNQIETLKKNLK